MMAGFHLPIFRLPTPSLIADNSNSVDQETAADRNEKVWSLFQHARLRFFNFKLILRF